MISAFNMKLRTLNYEQIKKDSQGISKIKPFIDLYNWKEIVCHHTEKTGKV